MATGKRDRAILLTGMMGSGKSAVGRELALRLGWTFVDTDARIERKRGLSVADIFRRDGESGFRALESAEIEALPSERAVVALGGGALIQARNREVLRRQGVLVWLDAAPETLVARLGECEDRPLLEGLSASEREERLRQVQQERAESYGEAEIRIPTDDRSPTQVCDAVLAALGRECAA